LPILAVKRFRTITGTAIASIGVLIGMWLERFLIIVPTLSHPRLTFNWHTYSPTWVEIMLAAGALSYFVILYLLFTKLFPVVAIWEYKEGLRLEQRAPVRGTRRAGAEGDPAPEAG
jgi:molybdopterin-containing oxidoreductase family membrane subunit